MRLEALAPEIQRLDRTYRVVLVFLAGPATIGPLKFEP